MNEKRHDTTDCQNAKNDNNMMDYRAIVNAWDGQEDRSTTTTPHKKKEKEKEKVDRKDPNPKNHPNDVNKLDGLEAGFKTMGTFEN